MPLSSLKALPFLLCLSLSGRLAADESATDTPADALQDVSDLVSDMDNYEAPPPAGAQTSGKEMWVRAHALHIRAEPAMKAPSRVISATAQKSLLRLPGHGLKSV